METRLPDDAWLDNVHLSGDQCCCAVRCAPGPAAASGAPPPPEGDAFAAGGADCCVQLHHPATLRDGGVVGSHEAAVHAVAAFPPPVSGSGSGGAPTSRLATASGDTLRIFALPGGELQHVAARSPLPLRACCWSAGGGLLAAGGDDGDVRLLRVPPGGDGEVTVAAALRGGRGPVRALAFSPTVRPRTHACGGTIPATTSHSSNHTAL